jgi:Zn-dependent peptidase ImmA (M78 family)
MLLHPRVDRTVRLARRFVNIRRFDDPFELYRQHGWILFSSSEIQKITGMQDPFGVRKKEMDAKTYRRFDDVYITIYNETKDSDRIRWTLAHEIGHIILGHFCFFS